MPLTASISNIARCSLHDGPGVRTVVYFKGCGLRCRWCHNPETLTARPDILYAPVKCIHCGRCVEVCPEHHLVEADRVVFRREGCETCGRCVQVCPSGALSASGCMYTVEEVLRQVRKDAHFYRATGGGVTLSGGECLLHAEFAEELLKKCKAEDMHTAVETALFVPWENVERVAPYCDLFMADCKLPDSEKHRRYTGHGNERILENLCRLAERAKGRVLLRIPLIPGVNDAKEDMLAFAERIRAFRDGLVGIELLKYNSLAGSKYELAGMAYEAFGEAQSDEYIGELCEILGSELSGTSVRF